MRMHLVDASTVPPRKPITSLEHRCACRSISSRAAGATVTAKGCAAAECGTHEKAQHGTWWIHKALAFELRSGEEVAQRRQVDLAFGILAALPPRLWVGARDACRVPNRRVCSDGSGGNEWTGN